MNALTAFYDLPKEWEVVRLGDMATFLKGKGLSKSHVSSQAKYECILYGELFTHYNRVITNIKSFTNIYDNPILSLNNDVLMATSGETPEILATASCILKKGVILGGDILVIRPSSNLLDGCFLAYCIVNSKKQILSKVVGSTVYHLYAKDMKDFEILLPPLKEQKAIATILNDFDSYIHSLNTLILKKENIKKALSFELLSQKKRLKGFNGVWEKVRLGDIAEIKRGASPRPIENPKWFCINSSIGWVRISDISKNSCFLYKTTQKLSKEGVKRSRFVKKDSLIMSMCATIGKPIITKIDTCIHDGFVVFENPKINLFYLYYFLCSIEREWLESGQQGSQINLNVDLIKNKEIFYPKNLDEQKAIATILSDLDKEITSLKNKKMKFQNIKKSLNNDLMNAKIRV
ncbi:restriction endonuclease subunit S [Helicobacter cetorum]|uniref:Restriction modification system DNA specificity domain protein n=1 Tax=Helicobacter cetorum (strain ATCC BAA-540 / CCUG 52418 / MIT 99-5656) TaxID=1163745 RepID=I0ESD0_HELCM|nr:restriction endonuclease subunit S [Helicobacter cetorum]AFI05849.1 restriction modification system DNA specificity domain protein [Helicobacter cetorum MIT 99-5656]